MTKPLCATCINYKPHQVVRATSTEYGAEYMDCVLKYIEIIEDKCEDYTEK